MLFFKPLYFQIAENNIWSLLRLLQLPQPNHIIIIVFLLLNEVITIISLWVMRVRTIKIGASILYNNITSRYIIIYTYIHEVVLMDT